MLIIEGQTIGTPMTTLSEQDIQRNMRAVAYSIAQQELEGLRIPDATIEDMKRAAQGEIRSEDVIRNIHTRLKNAQYPAMTTTSTRNRVF